MLFMKRSTIERGTRFKRKGFTLIELIAVIAILAILGMILVPKIAGYTSKAKKSNLQTSARTLLDAIKAHNADAVGVAADDGGPITDADSVDDAATKINYGLTSKIIANDTTNANSSFSKLKDIKVAQLVTVATGNFSIDSSGVINTSNLATGSIE
ncbi:MAG TPA: type II secretion system protein [Clostridiaceae bacterium]